MDEIWDIKVTCQRGHVFVVHGAEKNVDGNAVVPLQKVCPACALDPKRLSRRERRAMLKLRAPDRIPDDW